MNFWYEFPCDFVTVEYGRYEAVCDDGPGAHPHFRFTWTPILAGPQPVDPLSGLTDEEYAQATCPV